MQNNLLTQNIIALGNAYHLPNNWLAERPYLFSNITLNLASHQGDTIRNTVQAIEAVTASPAFRAQLLLNTPITLQKDPGNPGVLFGYDFHLTPEGPKLIEINTNAGGAFLAALLEAAHEKSSDILQLWETQFIKMFFAEWQSIRPLQSLNTIAIVDKNPCGQYFYPEFLLFQALFEKHGIRCIIVEPAAFSLQKNKLWANDIPIDLIYNRLTDFDLSQPEHHVLQQAYLQNDVVLTPHPYAHALYAHKRNLTLLSNRDLLLRCGADDKIINQLQQVIPLAYMVDPNNAENLWDIRKQFFFKPVSGYGGKGVYRGYNITKRVFDQILANDYIAQILIPPSEIQVDGEKRKVDLRAYTYAGQTLGFTARLYQGQTTNLRTVGGGFTMVKED